MTPAVNNKTPHKGESSVGLIILAAGGSTRLGTPKQLLRYGNTTLLLHSVEIALNSGCRPVVVVVSRNDFVPAATPVCIAKNPDWRRGIASSIVVGMERLLQIAPQIKAVIFMVCDQPLLSNTVLTKILLAYRESDKNIIACEYAGTIGVPALFTRRFFGDLEQLSGHEGAKKVILQNPSQVTAVAFPQGAIDIDTGEDYLRLQEMEGNDRGT